MTSNHRDAVQFALQTAQLLTLVIGVGGLFMAMGRRDANLETNTGEIEKLRSIATDLASASVESTSTNRSQDRQLDDLRDRIARLEPND